MKIPIFFPKSRDQKYWKIPGFGKIPSRKIPGLKFLIPLGPGSELEKGNMSHKIVEMKFYGHLCILLLSTEASSNNISLLRRTGAVAQTNVVSLTFCESNLPPQDKMGKKTLEEVHTYAELKHDPRASLPDSFTVSSTIMANTFNRRHFLTF